jgi:hypothetical protein
VAALSGRPDHLIPDMMLPKINSFGIRRAGRDVRAWPMLALLLLVVLVAIGCVLWFMHEAMRNERLAVREKLAEAYRGHLSLAQAQISERWKQWLARLDDLELNASGFARCVREGLADSVLLTDTQGRIVYPSDSRERSVEANAQLLALESATNRTSEAVVRLRNQLND